MYIPTPGKSPERAIKELGDRLFAWMRENRADYLHAMVQAVGDQSDAWIRTQHGHHMEDNLPPQEIFEQMVALRGELAEPGKGAFTYARFVVEIGSSRLAIYRDSIREPQFRPPYTEKDCEIELTRFPRDEEHTPRWLRTHGHERDAATSLKKLDEKVLEHYCPLVPDDIADMWRQYGVGYLGHGLVRIADPDKIVKALHEFIPVGDEMVPVFTTAFGDIIYWRPSGFLIHDYRHRRYADLGDVDGLTMIRAIVYDKDFQNEFLDAETYAKIAPRSGIPDTDICLGYVPLLAFGGPEDPSRLDPVDMLIHIAFMIQAAGAPS